MSELDDQNDEVFNPFNQLKKEARSRAASNELAQNTYRNPFTENQVIFWNKNFQDAEL